MPWTRSDETPLLASRDAARKWRFAKSLTFSEMLQGIVEEMRLQPPPIPTEEVAETQPHVAPKLATVQSSHLLGHRGAWTWCRRCGCHTRGQRLRKPREPGGLPGPEGRSALRRVARGRPPLSSADVWGDEKDFL